MTRQHVQFREVPRLKGSPELFNWSNRGGKTYRHWNQHSVLAVVFLVSATALLTTSHAAPYTGLVFTGSANSWVADGQTQIALADDGWTFHTTHTVPPPASVRDSLTFDMSRNVDFNYEWWNLSVKAPIGQRLLPGLYENIQRTPFADPQVPGFELSGNGRGNNTYSGSFKILEAVYLPDNLGASVIQFAMDFSYYEDDDPSRWTYGSFRYNSSIPIPEPSPLQLSAYGLCGALVLIRFRSVAQKTVNTNSH
jgi:hypothetical protein